MGPSISKSQMGLGNLKVQDMINLEVSWNRGTTKSSNLMHGNGIFHLETIRLGVPPFMENPHGCF